MFRTLQEYRADPLLIKRFTHIQPVPCVCVRCGFEHYKVKRSVEMALANSEQEHFFCTKKCRGLFQGEQWEVRDGVEGRVCKDCHQWVPKAKVHGHRGWICDPCFQRYPQTKYRTYKHSAVTRKIPFDLTYREFLTYWQKPCAYCGTPISTIGLDRKDNTLGYTANNVGSCCAACNWMKGDGTVEEFLDRCLRVARRHP